MPTSITRDEIQKRLGEIKRAVHGAGSAAETLRALELLDEDNEVPQWVINLFNASMKDGLLAAIICCAGEADRVTELLETRLVFEPERVRAAS